MSTPLRRNSAGLLVAWLKVAPEHDEEFNEWYDTEHLAQIAGLPGFHNGRRYRALDGDPWYMAIYELDSAEVIQGPAFQKAIAEPTPWSRRIRRFYGQNRIRHVYRTVLHAGGSARPARCVHFVKTAEALAPETASALARVPGCLGARVLAAVEGEPAHALLCELESPDVLAAPGFAQTHAQGRAYRLLLATDAKEAL